MAKLGLGFTKKLTKEVTNKSSSPGGTIKKATKKSLSPGSSLKSK